MNLGEEQILSLAPDESSKKAGLGLAQPGKWANTGANEKALWGECQGSGSKPYQTQVDRSSIAFKCSCPSRKFPCKHGIALGLLYARQPALFTQTELPPWVSEWIGKRAQKEETVKAEKPVDEAAQAKRQQAREQKVADGIGELLVWIGDIVRHGLIGLPDKDPAYWEGTARRMVDAQAPGLAGMVRSLAAVNFFREGWQEEFLNNLLSLYLVAKAYQNKQSLSPPLLQEVRGWIGFTVNQDELKEGPGIRDTWIVLGKQVSDDDNITVERNWLYGLGTQQYALVLQFIVRGQGGALLLSPGLFIDAELAFYPSVVPLRALVKSHTHAAPSAPRQLFGSWKDVAEAEAAAYAAFPARNDRPYAIESLVPVHYEGRWWLKDRNEDLMSIKENFGGIWKLLALSGGRPLHMAVVGRGSQYEPVGVWHQQSYKGI